jgi:hypothetical protein
MHAQTAGPRHHEMHIQKCRETRIENKETAHEVALYEKTCRERQNQEDADEFENPGYERPGKETDSPPEGPLPF